MIQAKTDFGITDVRGLQIHRDKLVEEKARLATELKKVENLLKIKVDTEKASTTLLKTQMDHINKQLRDN